MTAASRATDCATLGHFTAPSSGGVPFHTYHGLEWCFGCGEYVQPSSAAPDSPPERS